MPATKDGLPCNRVRSRQSGRIEIEVCSEDLDEILALMMNKRQRNDAEGYNYNARRYVQTAGKLADEALLDLARSEKQSHSRYMRVSCLLGSIAVFCAPVSVVGLILPTALTLIVIECLNLRMKRRVADILAYSVSHDQDMTIQLDFRDSPAETVKIPAKKGGIDG